MKNSGCWPHFRCWFPPASHGSSRFTCSSADMSSLFSTVPTKISFHLAGSDWMMRKFLFLPVFKWWDRMKEVARFGWYWWKQKQKQNYCSLDRKNKPLLCYQDKCKLILSNKITCICYNFLAHYVKVETTLYCNEINGFSFKKKRNSYVSFLKFSFSVHKNLKTQQE